MNFIFNGDVGNFISVGGDEAQSFAFGPSDSSEELTVVTQQELDLDESQEMVFSLEASQTYDDGSLKRFFLEDYQQEFDESLADEQCLIDIYALQVELKSSIDAFNNAISNLELETMELLDVILDSGSRISNNQDFLDWIGSAQNTFLSDVE